MSRNYNRVNLYKERSETFTKRTVSILERINFTADFNKELDDFREGLLNMGCEGFSIAEDAMDFSASLADEYMLLSDGIYSAVLTGLFHLWERDIKDLCIHLLRYNPITKRNKPVTEQDLHNYNYDKLKSILIFWGAEESVFHEVNLLRLVVNTVKHNAGPSAAELLASNSKYYHKLSILCDLRNGDFMKDDEIEVLSIDDIKYFGSVIITFWEELGKSIYV